MKQLFLLSATFVLIVSVLLTSCVSNKKFTLSEAKVAKLKKDSVSTHSKLYECTDLLVSCNDQLTNCGLKVTGLNSQISNLEITNDSIKDNLNTLSAESKMTIADQQSRLKAFQSMLQAQKDVMTKLKNTIANALMNYKTDELYVFYKDGNVYVSLSEKLLFKSGSDVVDPKGVEALKSLAKVLKGTTDIAVNIEGHTDNVPIKTAVFRDNWDLSTARATSIVRILCADNGFDPKRIIASGRGEFYPVKSNETDKERASNRRTEVILSPDLKELYKLIYP